MCLDFDSSFCATSGFRGRSFRLRLRTFVIEHRHVAGCVLLGFSVVLLENHSSVLHAAFRNIFDLFSGFLLKIGPLIEFFFARFFAPPISVEGVAPLGFPIDFSFFFLLFFPQTGRTVVQVSRRRFLCVSELRLALKGTSFPFFFPLPSLFFSCVGSSYGCPFLLLPGPLRRCRKTPLLPFLVGDPGVLWICRQRTVLYSQ